MGIHRPKEQCEKLSKHMAGIWEKRRQKREVAVPTLSAIQRENRWQDRLKQLNAAKEADRLKRREERQLANQQQQAELPPEPEKPLTFEQMENRHILAHAQAMAGLRQTIKLGIYPLRDLQENYFD